jgi:hypothetical protein
MLVMATLRGLPMIDVGLRLRSVAARANRRACALAALGFVLLAAALAGALAQTSGCARCGPSSAVLGLAPPFGASGTIVGREAPRRETRREKSWREAGGGSYMVCVRACDGGFFPVTYFGSGSRRDTLEEVCRSLCPNAEVELFSFPFGGTIDEAVSSAGQPYGLLPNAHKFEQTYDSSCSCRGSGESWAQALARAEARYGHGPRDILVTEEASARMSRPIGDIKAKPAQSSPAIAAMPMRVEGADPSQSDIVSDINGVDTKLSAAAASMSRVTSGIKDRMGEGRAIYGVNQGQTVEEAGPDGKPRRVRIVAPAF